MRFCKLLLILVSVLTAVVAARALGLWTANQLWPTPKTSQPPTPAIVFAEDDLTFGPIPETEAVERQLRITNTSAEQVTIDRFETSCSCLGVEPTANVTVGPGETQLLRIKLKTTIPAGATLTVGGIFHEDVTVTPVVGEAESKNARRFPTTITYSVRQTVRFEPPVVQLGVASHREPLQVKATLTLVDPIRDVRVLPHPEWEVGVREAGPDKREITATPVRVGQPRVVEDPIHVVPIGSDGQERPARALLIRGEIRSDVVSLPADLPLGLVKVGTTAEESFRLRSLTNREFEVVKIESDSQDVTVSADASDRKQFTARTKVAGRGNQERWVKVTVRQDDASEGVVRIPIRYLGN